VTAFLAVAAALVVYLGVALAVAAALVVSLAVAVVSIGVAAVV
jgi:hypothetical protein